MKVIGFAGWSGSGKTTLVEQVIGVLAVRGVKVSLVKHAHHSFDIDHRGKDSWRHRAAGCHEVLVSSRNRWSLIHETRGEREATLDELLALLSDCDIALVEGFKRAEIDKIEVYRQGASESMLFPHDPRIVAIATNTPGLESGGRPLLDINNPEQVAEFVLAHCLGRTAVAPGIA